MLKERIEQYFQQYPQLRVLFFFDEEKEHEEEYLAMDLEGIRKVTFDNRNFYLKVMLHGEWSAERVFLYFQQPMPSTQDEYRHFPLLDLLVANKVLYLDNVADFMDQFQLAPNQRSLAKRYIKELTRTPIQKVVAPLLTRTRFEESELVIGLISAFLRFTKIERWETILAKILCLGLPGQEENRDYFFRKIDANILYPFLVQPIRDYFNTTLEELNQQTLIELQNRLKYNLITYTLDEKPDDPYKNLKIQDGVVLSMLSNLSESALNNPKLADQFLQLLESNDSQIKEETLLQIYGSESEFGYLTTFMKWKILSSGIREIDFKPQTALQVFERVSMFRENTVQLSNTVRFLIYLANINSQLNEISGYIYDSPDEYIEKYAQDFYRIDQNYRKAIDFYRSVDVSELPDFIQLDPLKDLLEDRYESFLEKLNREWLKCFSEQGFSYANLATPKQYDFIKREIVPYELKIVVIISDALRYESAMSLLSELHGDSKNEAVIRHQLASIPSTTQFGMANLLTTKTINLKDAELFIDDVSTEGLANRSKILKKHVQDAQVFAYAEIEGNSQQANRDIFKSSLVYIYHDCIDAVGDKRPSERNSFKAVADGIAELAAMVKKLHSSYNVSRVIITADHGFIYNDRTIKEADKEPLNEEGAILTHNRYAIIKNDRKQDLGYKIPLKQTNRIDSDLFVLVPKSVNRYKKQGVGHQFVHGGASLQELIVPVIESTRKRTEVIKKVKPVLISKNLRVVSNILRIQILQDQRVSRNEKEREILVGLYRDLELVSNQVTIQMSSTSELPSERSYGCELMLRGDIGNISMLKLKIYDKDDELNPLIIQEVINNTLIESDF
ncbi:cytoplasmic protein [Aquipluma nitroreducens]|uniref:Cytoplasmic protein n=1 Tax=Aquipluma nitroreducens TaxID=2010828 RepID=A0A5K7SG30_9BACT|nr:BREX-1 system phosphatase PglZ type A [Aquipluma nitroreducens]BBE20445.1 cytoplasmic protein [Aquipluma nitroreducens]